MVPTCKNVTPYSPTPLNVGTVVNDPLCNGLYLLLPFFMPFLHPYNFCRKFSLFLVSAFFMEQELRCVI